MVVAMGGGPDAVLARVAQVFAPLVERVRALEALQAKDRHNSNQPPSTDATRTGRAPRRLRETTGQRPGGQPGHPGRAASTPRPLLGGRSNTRLDRFTLRGQPKVDAQWKRYCLVHNIEKLAHHGYAARAA